MRYKFKSINLFHFLEEMIAAINMGKAIRNVAEGVLKNSIKKIASTTPEGSPTLQRPVKPIEAQYAGARAGLTAGPIGTTAKRSQG